MEYIFKDNHWSVSVLLSVKSNIMLAKSGTLVKASDYLNNKNFSFQSFLSETEPIHTGATSKYYSDHLRKAIKEEVGYNMALVKNNTNTIPIKRYKIAFKKGSNYLNSRKNCSIRNFDIVYSIPTPKLILSN